MNEWAQPLGLVLITAAVGAYLVRRWARREPERRRWAQLAAVVDVALLASLAILLVRALWGGLPQ